MNDRPRMRPPGARAQVARVLAVLLCGPLIACGDSSPGADPATTVHPEYDYATTLSRLPVDFASHLTMSGTGHVNGRVEQGRLVLTGVFQDVESAVTEAHLHQARPGLRGASVASLAIATAGEGKSGTITGAVDLTADLSQALENAELYIQIRSVDNPEGVLRGWLFPPR